MSGPTTLAIAGGIGIAFGPTIIMQSIKQAPREGK